MIVASAAAGCSVSVTEGDGGATGGTGGTGGSTGGSGGSGGTGGTAGAAGAGGSSGSGGAGGTTDGGGGSAGSGGGTTCNSNPNLDGRCHTCAFNRCNMEHCACNAVTTCRTPMLAFYSCASAPNADFDMCALQFVTNANPDAMGGGLANDLGACIDTECVGICAGMDASARNKNGPQSWKAAIEAVTNGNTR